MAPKRATYGLDLRFGFPMKLLPYGTCRDPPAHPTHLLCSLRVVLSLVVGHDIVRAVVKNHKPKQCYGKVALLGRAARKPP